ncbi:putative secreted Zn-dependent protease [Neorhizobium huautlense]|uniref:Secreted Zn-dependent protease n=2 Tax=Neorhizobium huautlense TaxID=67774 RepID=A0ABT9PQG2_9HYPH|nr:putative secreted Zn-dependent protease [Neorhizobium huautlense]
MTTKIRHAAIALAALMAIPALAAAQGTRNWKPAEQLKTYAIAGKSGIELYQSIGERGPAAGVGQAIAHTTFKLLWTRDYRPQPNGACTLAVARPSLTIIYTMPKGPAALSGDTKNRWTNFIEGVEKHERVHGQHIVEMVEKIEAFSLGLTAENDPKCVKVREVLQARLKVLSDEQRQRGRDFDAVELSPGGAVHQLILALVNPPGAPPVEMAPKPTPLPGITSLPGVKPAR